jgi:predicted transcriptional regulator
MQETPKDDDRDYETWFAQAVAEGLASADRGDFVEHSDVEAMIESRFPGYGRRPQAI